MDLYNANSLKQQSAGRHVVTVLIPCQPVFALTPLYCAPSGEAANTNFLGFGLITRGSTLQSILLKARTLNVPITPPILLGGFGILSKDYMSCYIY